MTENRSSSPQPLPIVNATQHSMQRRSAAHDYSLPGFYHITLHVAEGMGQPLGAVIGSEADAATVALTEVGTAVEHELLTAINTALTPAALRGYLKRECPAHLATPETLAQIERRLLVAGDKITCHSYGERGLQ